MNNNNLLKGAIVLLICLFGTYMVFFPPIHSGETIPNPDDPNLAIIDTNSVCMDYNRYNHSTLTVGLVNEMVSIYRKNQLQSIQNATINPVPEDAYAIWFDLDTIKKFIYHIEKGVRQNKATGSKLGLRLYYAAYPDSTKFGRSGYEDLAGFAKDPLTRSYEKRHTLVMIPTIENEKNVAMDFDPFVKTTYSTGIINPKEVMKTDLSTGGSVQTIFEGSFTNQTPTTALSPSMKSTTARNHGNLYPPGLPTLLGF